MSSLPPKSEGRRRPVSVLALKLWEAAEALDVRLENPAEMLELLISAVAKGEQPSDPWKRLHDAAVKHDKVADLAFAYENSLGDKRIKLMPPEQQAYVHLQAARFFSEVFGDADGAAAAAERALHAVPGHAEAFAMLEQLLSHAEGGARLAQHYVDASGREADPTRKLGYLKRALQLLSDAPRAEDQSVEVGLRVLKLDPADRATREMVMRRLLERSRHKEVVDLLEATLRREPQPSAEEIKESRELLLDLSLTALKEPLRALTHAEGLLAIDPVHEQARKAAEGLLEHRQFGLRAAAALSDAYEKAGDTQRAIGMLTLELKQVRGPRRVEVQRRLGILRQDALDDPAGALELLAPVVAGDPGDDALRRRFVDLSLSLNQPAQAARLLSRALQTSRDQSVRARVAVDVGNVYLKSGDAKKAQTAFQQVLEIGADDGAMLDAARRLAELYTESGELKQLSTVLEIVVRHEPEREAKQAAARRLARLCDAEVPDTGRAIVAFRALVGSPWTDEALRRLEALYGETHDEEGLADVLSHRAERTKDPREARELAFKAAELRTERTRNRPAAIEAWQKLSDKYGASSEINARLIPLLEQEGRWDDVVELLRKNVSAAASDTERLELLTRLGQLQLTRQRDATAALATFRQALTIDRGHKPSRAAVEKLLNSGEARLAAAEVLEPLYRDDEPGSGLIRVLELRAELDAEAARGLGALAEALTLAEQRLGDRERALEIAGRGLKQAIVVDPAAVQSWLAHLQRLASAAGNSVRRAALLDEALGTRAVDSPELFEVARAAGEALAASGDVPRAVEMYRRALVHSPGSRELLSRIDELLAQQGAPEERLSLYRSALEQERDATRRRELLHTIAALQWRELRDQKSAIATWRVAAEEDPRDMVAHDALIAAFTDAGDWNSVYAELSRVLPHLEGDRRVLVLLRLSEVALQRGEKGVALQHYRELLSASELSDDVLATIEQLAREQNDGPTTRIVIERRLAATGDPQVRAGLLERLGNALAWQLNDNAEAARVWLEGARLSEGAAKDSERAKKLYERVIDADPDCREAAERLVELCAQSADWDKLQEVFESLVRLAKERELVMLLVGLEEQAVESGRLGDYVRMIDLALGRVDRGRARHVLLAKARTLGLIPGQQDAALALYRELLEAAGDEALPEAEAFEAFLKSCEVTPERKAHGRWLYEWRLKHAANAADVLLSWAQTEESSFGDLPAAARLYEQLLALDPERTETLTELARLELALGDVDKALSALEALRARSEGDMRTAAELKIAALLFEPLGRALEAVEMCVPILQKNPGEAEALRLLHRALSVPESRGRAAELLEGVAEAAGDAASRADVIEALLAVTADAPELAAARSRWLTQLLKTKDDEPENAMRVALRGAEAAPAEAELWNVAEEMARRLNTPNPVAEAYEHALGRKLAPELADTLGRRMVEFHEEWFDDQERVIKLLERILELSPGAGWAFDRLKLAFNAAGRWPELFVLYDRRLEAPIEAHEAIDILREAAMAAKDFAGDAERAIGYLERLNKQSPGDARVDAALERLYERHGHKRPLIDLLSARLPALAEADRGELNGRVAALWLDLGEPVPAYDISSKLLGSKHDERAAVALLERTLSMPASAQHKLGKKGKGGTVLSNAAKLLKNHYREVGSTVDVVRMLEIEVDCSDDKGTKIERLEEIVKLRLDALADAPGAFETIASLLQLKPQSADYRSRFAELAAQTGVQERRADVLIAVARGELPAPLRAELLAEAAQVCDREFDARERALDLFREVVMLRADNAEAGLSGARRLAAMLREYAPSEELVSVLEILSTLEESVDAKRAVLGEAAGLAFGALGDAERAIRDYRARLELGREDFEAIDGLCRALEAAQRWDELIVSLEERAVLAAEPAAARADRIRIAGIHAEIKNDRPQAIEAWRLVRKLHGRDVENFTALSALLGGESRYEELSALVEDEVGSEQDPARRAGLYAELGDLHEHRTGRPREALEAYVAAGDWQRAIRVAGTQYQDRDLGRTIAERLLELAVAAWQASGELGEAATTADWALNELSQRLLEAGNYADVVERLLEASKLPFTITRRRELRHEAACLSSDRLGDGDRAIALFQELLDESPTDEVAGNSVTRLASLLEEKGRTADIVELWERQASARAGGDDASSAAVLWARAADLAEERLNDVERAIKDHERGAELGGEASLEALARIHTERDQPLSAAAALETLCAQSSPEALADRALRLAAAYSKAGQADKARASLERALPRGVETQGMRARLAELYRDSRDYTALAALIAEEADRTDDRKLRLGHLREAASLHVDKRNDPAAAVPLLERAVELDADDPKLRLRLSQALHMCKRFDDAARVLRDQLQRYGARRPKDRAQVHFQLARVLLAATQEADALTELDTASRIDPAHPGIMQMLARVAFKQGELDRAERMYRALLLTAGRDDDPESPGKTEALVSLSEIAGKRGDELRAGEFIESAFEAALENPKEATVLDQALRSRGRFDLLGRLLEARLAQSSGPEQTAVLLADLASVHVEGLKNADQVRSQLIGRARAVQQELESTATTTDEAWAALGRVYHWFGDASAEGAILERRVSMSATSTRPPADPDLYYRLAAVRLADPEQREQGFELLEGALDAKPDFERAEEILRQTAEGATGDPRAANLLERIARASGDSRALASALLVRMSSPDCTAAMVREGIDLAKQLNDTGLIARMIDSAVQNMALSLTAADAAFLRLELADIKQAEGDLESALELREAAAPGLDPAEARTLLLGVAQAAQKLGQDERTARIYAGLLEQQAADREIWEPLLELYRRTNQTEKWVALIERTVPIVETAQERNALRLEQARVLVERGGSKQAISALKEILAEEPGQPQAAHLLSDLLEREGREQELAELLKSELDIAKDRSDVETITRLSFKLLRLLEKRKRIDEALDVARAGLEWKGDDRQLLTALVRLSERSGDPMQIADALESQLKVETGPAAADLGRRLSALREELGEPEAAERALELASAACPDDQALREVIIARYSARKDFARVASLLAKAIAGKPGDRELGERLVEAQRAAGQNEDALATLETLVASNPDEIELLRRRAQLLSELGREQEAIGDFERAYAAEPSLAGELAAALRRAIARAGAEQVGPLTLRLVEVLESTSDLTSARAVLADYLNSNPNDVDGFRRLASLDARTGNMDEALATLSRLVSLETGPGLVQTALRYAELCEMAGRTADARAALEKALEVERTNADLRHRLELLYESIGATRELANMLLDDAEVSTDMDARLGLLLRAADLLLLPDGDTEAAIRILEFARGESPESIEAVVLLARAYSGASRNEEALAMLQGVAEGHRGRRTKALSAVYEQIASIHLEEGFLTDALQALSKAFEMDSKNARLAMLLGRLAVDIEEDEIAQRAFRSVTIMRTADPSDPDGAQPENKADANYYLAVLAQKQGDARKAKVLVAKALAENSSHEAARTLQGELDKR